MFTALHSYYISVNHINWKVVVFKNIFKLKYFFTFDISIIKVYRRICKFIRKRSINTTQNRYFTIQNIISRCARNTYTKICRPNFSHPSSITRLNSPFDHFIFYWVSTEKVFLDSTAATTTCGNNTQSFKFFRYF